MESTVPVAFFSYSRHDSDFVQRLARDLRAGGAQVWLDQLDIQPGQRWDSAVESALASCPTMLLVLSPSSVDSTNVMDEVSFALEGHKLVVPILYQDCKIPFRLRRVQYIDVRTDYDSGLHELLHMLSGSSGTGTVAATAVPLAVPAPADPLPRPAPASDPVRTPVRDTRAEAPRRPTRESEPRVSERAAAFPARPSAADAGMHESAPPVQSSSRWLMIGVLAVVAVIGLVIGMRQSSSGSRASRAPSAGEDAPSGPSAPPASPAPSESDSRTEPAVETSIETLANARWIDAFLEAQAGPAPRALRPYFAEVVTPYYGLPSASWPAIEKDKQAFFARFPTLRYRRASDLRWTTGAEGDVLEFDMSFENIRRDGVAGKGRTHLKMTVRSIDGAPRIVGIEERSVRD